MMRQQKNLRMPTKENFNSDKISRVILQLQVNCNTYICNQLCNEATKLSQLFSHGKQAPCIERQAFGVFQKEICEHKEQKQLVMVTTSSNVSALRASFSAANSKVKAKKPLTNGEELILPAAKDNFHELLGEAAVQKVAPFPLLASTIAR